MYQEFKNLDKELYRALEQASGEADTERIRNVSVSIDVLDQERSVWQATHPHRDFDEYIDGLVDETREYANQ